MPPSLHQREETRPIEEVVVAATSVWDSVFDMLTSPVECFVY
jgi:hypothetical protein